MSVNIKIETPRASATRRLLQEANEKLKRARELLMADEVDYASATALLIEVVWLDLRAFLTWHGTALPEDAPLSQWARRAISLASILKTPLGRARKLIPIAERLSSAGGASPSVQDRQAVRAGFYTVRNLYFTLLGELPQATRPESALPPDANLQRASTRAASLRGAHAPSA